MKFHYILFFLFISLTSNSQVKHKGDSLDNILESSKNIRQVLVDSILPIGEPLKIYYDKNSNIIDWGLDSEKLVLEAYERSKKIIDVSHILIRLEKDDNDTIDVYNKIQKLRIPLLNEDIDSLIKKYHNEKDIIVENLGYFSVFKMIYDFENVAYNTKVGEVSMPFRTKFGYHILKVNGERESLGEVEVGHIMAYKNKQGAREKIYRLYDSIKKGSNFESLAIYSEDENSRMRKGRLSPFSMGQLNSPSFEEMAYSLELNEISSPVETKLGWHIIKLYSKYKKPFEDVRGELFDRTIRSFRYKNSSYSWDSIIPKNAVFYRKLTLKSKNTPLNKISDYYIDYNWSTKLNNRKKIDFYANYLGHNSSGNDSISFNGAVTLYDKGKIQKKQFYLDNIKNGLEIEYYSNGNKKYQRNYVDGKIEGEEVGYYPQGNIKYKRNFIDGLIQGNEVGFYDYSNPKRKYIKSYVNGIPDLNEIEYYGNGDRLLDRTYNKELDQVIETGYAANGNLEYKKYYVDEISNKIINKIITYFPNENIEFTGTLKYGLLDGLATGYYKSGEKKYTLNYNNGLKNGLLQVFYKNGNIERKVVYKNDLKQGEEVGYYNNGDRKFYRNYIDDKLNGVDKNFDEDKNIISEKNWINNIIDGQSKSFHINGKIKSIINYINGLKNGDFKEFYISGNILLKGNYVDDEKQSEITYYYETGEVKSIENITNGEKNGIEIVYFKNGEIKSKSNYTKGKINGEYIENLEETGEMIYSVNYINGEKFGEEIKYYSNCLPSIRRNYVNNIVQGEEITYYESTGGIKSKTMYQNGIKQGKTIKYYDSGEILSEGFYLDNILDGWEMGFYRSGEKKFNIYHKREYEYPGSIKILANISSTETGYYKSGEKKWDKQYSFNKLIEGESHKTFYKNGKIESVFTINDKGSPISEIGFYNTTIDSISIGEKKYERGYVDGVIQGEEITLYETGEKKSTVLYQNGRRDGLEVFYYRDGDVNYSVLWENGIRKEKRIALVIGNADYDKGKLLNPVNDANLIAKSLEKLDFEVIIEENLATRREMLDVISDFGDKRKDYDIGFFYYAGHGVQLNNQNYLLPVKEEFEKDYHVTDRAVSMQSVLRFLESFRENQLNFIVLDACRDNPFEQNWNRTRSRKGGGLAKIPPPTGSLIAFSTDHGQTAADGDENNSLYSQVLAEKMLEENVSIEQVFKNVRTKVLKLSEEQGLIQSPVEESKLTGKEFYLNKKTEE